MAALGQTRCVEPFYPDTPPTAPYYPDIREVKGQGQAKRALKIVSVLMSGTPGISKTMLPTRFPGILTQMSAIDALCAPDAQGEALLHHMPLPA